MIEVTGNIIVHHPEPNPRQEPAMTVSIITDARARQLITSQCRQFVEDTPADEPGHEWDNRVEHLAKHLAAATGADIENAVSELREILTTIEELQSVDAGTHWRIRKNRALTIDNTADLLDELTNKTLPEQLYFLLQVAGFRPAREGAAA